MLTTGSTRLAVSRGQQTWYDVRQMLDKLNVSKSPGPDELHPRILYETRTKITTPLKLIFEASLELKELPHDWVNANISAVYKKGKKSELCNYRPISLTSILCKIMEQFIRDYIIQHFFTTNF